MAFLKSKTLFFITSPRSPLKMRSEISVLIKYFSGEIWNNNTQTSFMKKLVEEPEFNGEGSPSDLAFSARDRINRGPKALGFVDLSPSIALTNSGKQFLDNEMTEEIFLRQLLKFQLPSPYHTETSELKGLFCVKPYLEIFRLIYTLKSITFDEIKIFGMQLTDYKKFDSIVKKILKFRNDKRNNSKNYKVFVGEYIKKEICSIYKEEIKNGMTKTRESNDNSLEKFVATKISNSRDYADACFRYLRATGLVAISQKGNSLSIIPEKLDEVEFFLKTIDREPCYVDDEVSYKEYLFDESLPILFTDNRTNLECEAKKLGIAVNSKCTISQLKKVIKRSIRKRKESIIANQIINLKKYKEFNDILSTFDDIEQKNFYDIPLMLEWNTWRAMTMLDGGNIQANLKFDDSGQPMSTASGNQADIICDYKDFYLTVEVTMQTGQRQYEMEGEPVTRHLANVKKEINKKAYCFFIAPKINDSCIAHFFSLHRINISYYGGTSVILPLELEIFKKMVEKSSKSKDIPTSKQIMDLCEYSNKIANKAKDEVEWYNLVKCKAVNWLD